MSHLSDPRKSLLPFGNPLRMMFPKGSSLSPNLRNLLNTFEASLSKNLRKLKPENKAGIQSLSWMKTAMESLSEIHTDTKALIAALELPVSDWDHKWIDVYFDNSLKLLDISVAFSSEISRLKQGNLLLRCLLHNLSSKQLVRARSSMEEWRHRTSSKNPKLENCFSVMDGFAQTLHLPKIKNSPKGKVLARAVYGVKVVTLFVSNVLATVLSGSSHAFMDINVPETCLWADSFNELQNFVRNSDASVKLREMEEVDVAVKKLCPLAENESFEEELLRESSSELEKAAGNLREGLNLLGKEVDGFFRSVLTGRDALLSNIRFGNDVNAPDRLGPRNHPKGEMVR